MLVFLRFVARTRKGFLYTPEWTVLAPGALASPDESIKATSAPWAGTTAWLNQGLATQQGGRVYSLLSHHSGICFRP